ncbi:MAG TPA: hypothetical protein P5307_17730, partial [Pirellulaceae bacterium]|nr:hypothetical protein [Pirellulaceae bacterium]
KKMRTTSLDISSRRFVEVNQRHVVGYVPFQGRRLVGLPSPASRAGYRMSRMAEDQRSGHLQ